jgi:hypothetical protein
MDVAKYLQEETNKRQEKNGGRVSGNGSNFLQQHLLYVMRVFCCCCCRCGGTGSEMTQKKAVNKEFKNDW